MTRGHRPPPSPGLLFVRRRWAGRPFSFLRPPRRINLTIYGVLITHPRSFMFSFRSCRPPIGYQGAKLDDDVYTTLK